MCPQITCIVTLVTYVWLFCMLSNVSYNPMPERMNIARTATLVNFFLLSAVCFLKCPQIACPIRYLITLVAVIPLFSSTVCCQMPVQPNCIRGCKITFVAFVCLFSTVCLHISPQMACPWRCQIMVNAFVWLFFFSTSWKLRQERELKFPFSRAREKLLSHFFSRFFEIETLVNDCLLLAQAPWCSPNLRTTSSLGSQGPCSARSGAAALQHFLLLCFEDIIFYILVR